MLLACSLLLLIFYSVPAFPLYDAATAGYLAWATVIPAGYMTLGVVLALVTTRQGVASIASSYLPSIALLAVGSALVICVLALPALGMKLSMPDESAQARGTMGYARPDGQHIGGLRGSARRTGGCRCRSPCFLAS